MNKTLDHSSSVETELEFLGDVLHHLADEIPTMNFHLQVTILTDDAETEVELIR